jgi:hypothetical protein
MPIPSSIVAGLRRKLTFWRVFAILIVIGAVVAVGAAFARAGTDVLTGQASGSIAARHHHWPDPVATRNAWRRSSDLGSRAPVP